ncbi:MAG: hypothetical protein J6Y33_07040 [Prevotella sp.]|nr:hypothetical protein [Prevotella sp.]
MKKITLLLVALMAWFTAEAKVIKISLADGTAKVFTSSELSYIDFNEDGTLTVVTYDGKQVEAIGATFDEMEISEQEMVTEEFDDVLYFDVDADGISIDFNIERPVRKINYVYPSVDPWGEPITLSGTILIPEEVFNNKRPCQGILLFNHYTKFHRNEAPTLSNGDLESLFLANPLNPDYIIVESDFYGFGATVRFPQAFVQGTINARASLDGLLAARQLLTERGIDYGPLCFNLGYSSGGFDAMNTQKLRDMEYADLISFDKTFAGGSPNDVRECYRQYVEINRSAYNAVPLLLMISTKETQKLDIEYSEVFQPYICDRIGELVLSKEYSSWPICDSIGREKMIDEILAPDFCDLNSEKSRQIQDILGSFNLANDDWTPDPTQRIYLMHSRGDDYVPIKSARPVIGFLRDRGFEPSIIPGRTNFQTNFVVRSMGHLTATLVYYIQTLAAIKAWPLMYTDNQLNPIYQCLVSQDIDPVMTMRQLDAMGFDCRKVISAAMAYLSSLPSTEEGGVSIQELVATALQKSGFTAEELIEMSEDSGLDIQKLMFDLIIYFSEKPKAEKEELVEVDEGPEVIEEGSKGTEKSNATRKALRRMARELDKPTTPAQAYELELRDWLKLY